MLLLQHPFSQLEHFKTKDICKITGYATTGNDVISQLAIFPLLPPIDKQDPT